MKKLLLLALSVPLSTGYLWAGGPVDGGGKDQKCRNAAPDAMEDFLFVEPASDQTTDCTDHNTQMQQGVITFYRWYLENSGRISAYEAREQNGEEDMVPPLNISWNRLQQYVIYIRKNYPQLDTIRVPQAKNVSMILNAQNDLPAEQGQAAVQQGIKPAPAPSRPSPSIYALKK